MDTQSKRIPAKFQLTAAKIDGSKVEVELSEGELLFVLGANGTGKSSLLLSLYGTNRSNAQRISAHRQTWFSSNAPNLSPQQKVNVLSNIGATDSTPISRWTDHNAEARAYIALLDLVEAENVRARGITEAIDRNETELATTLSKKGAPIKKINELLLLSNIRIEITINDQGLLVASKDQGTKYSIAELSDGERNALLIAAGVLTAKPGTLILIDEPERHLHRSIISPLLTHLFAERGDCAFVVSTHEVTLPMDNPEARTLLVRGCQYNYSGSSSSIAGWDMDLIPTDRQIDDDIRRTILGERRKILFIEGTNTSLDKPLYSLLFPNVSVVSKASCRDVEQAVTGIRAVPDLHWVKAFGIVDQDGRSKEDVEKIKKNGIYALTVFSVESIYYHPEIQKRLAQSQSDFSGLDANEMIKNAHREGIKEIKAHGQRMSRRVAEKLIREQVLKSLPGQPEIELGKPIELSINIAAVVATELARLEKSIAEGDLASLIARYPVRETGALHKIAIALGFQDRAHYHGAVLQLLARDKNAVEFVKSLFDTLPVDIAVD